jgi:hypothetical protein
VRRSDAEWEVVQIALVPGRPRWWRLWTPQRVLMILETFSCKCVGAEEGPTFESSSSGVLAFQVKMVLSLLTVSTWD